jgi:hypothetical protein
MTSAKCVIAGKISMSSFSRPPLMDPLGPKGRAPEIEDLGGFVRVCRSGWALRLEEKSEGTCFEVFIVCGGVLSPRRCERGKRSCATRKKSV